MNKPKRQNCQTELFADLWQLFYDFDKSLQYPNCEGLADEKRITKDFENKILKSFTKL